MSDVIDRASSAWLVFSKGFAPSFPTEGLIALKRACETDDPRLTQGSTTTPPPLACVQHWPCEAGDAISYVGFSSPAVPVKFEPSEKHTRCAVGDVEEFFARCCFEADQRLGEPAACRWFLNWFDDTPRDEMRRTLAAWCADELAARAVSVSER